MARRKNFFAFTDFNYTDGAAELFNNTIRNSFEFDAYTSDIFKARVIHKTQRSATDDYIYRIRILGDLSPHRFIEDPCELEAADLEEQKQLYNNLLSLHTKLITNVSLDRFDIIRVRLQRSGQSFNVVETRDFIEIDTKAIDADTGESLLEGGELVLFNKCEDLFNKAGEFESPDSGPAAVPIGEPLDQTALDQLMDNFYDAFRAYLISQGISSSDIYNTSRTRTTLAGRQMIMRLGLAANVPEVINFRDSNIEKFNDYARKKFDNFDESELTNELTEVVRKKTKAATGQEIAQPERSAHHPNTGYIAMDFQLVNQSSPSYGLLAGYIENFKTQPEYDNLLTIVYRTIPEANNGTQMCGKAKCGVLHVELLPSDEVSREYMANYTSINPYVTFEEENFADPGVQEEIDALYPPEYGETDTEDEFAPEYLESDVDPDAEDYGTSPS
jgi:hypothetical protein